MAHPRGGGAARRVLQSALGWGQTRDQAWKASVALAEWHETLLHLCTSLGQRVHRSLRNMGRPTGERRPWIVVEMPWCNCCFARQRDEQQEAKRPNPAGKTALLDTLGASGGKQKRFLKSWMTFFYLMRRRHALYKCVGSRWRLFDRIAILIKWFGYCLHCLHCTIFLIITFHITLLLFIFTHLSICLITVFISLNWIFAHFIDFWAFKNKLLSQSKIIQSEENWFHFIFTPL